MNGYLGNPKASAESFIDGWLKTGDVGTIDKQGRIFIVDRAKVRLRFYVSIDPCQFMLIVFDRI